MSKNHPLKTPNRQGIEVCVQIRDLGDTDDRDCPRYYTHRQRITEDALASFSNQQIVEDGMEMAMAEVVAEWREQRRHNPDE